MDAHTLGLARACVEMGLVGDLSGARVRDELVALLSERRIGHTLERLAGLGLAAAVHPALDCGSDAAARVDALDRALVRHAPELPHWRLRLAAMAHHMPGDELLAWLERLRVRRRDTRVIASVVAVAPRLATRLAQPREPAEIGELLDPHPLEVAVALAATASEPPVRQQAELYLTSLRFVELEIDGATLRDELGVPESPRVGEVLAELLRRRRNGLVGGREEQIAAARELAFEVPR